MTVFMLYIFNRNGCQFYREWMRPVSAHADDHKLMFGLVFSLKSFASRMDPLDASGAQTCSFHSFRTNTYKLTYMETPSGIKVILVADPRSGDLRDAVRHIYSAIFVEYCVKNPLYIPGQPFSCDLFIQALDSYVKTIAP